jgi:uncharacterized protein YqgC (DUF456 family)
MLLGLVGIIVPVLPGTIIIWLSVLAYAIVEGFEAIDWVTFSVLSIIALLTGTADIWMALLGAKTGGASGRSILYGIVGAIAGFFLLGALLPVIGSLFGGVIGYALGVLAGQYHKHQDWNLAIKASVGGLAGWGIATIMQLAGGVLILMIFVWQVLSF